MIHLLLTIIYLSFISLGLPDGLLGASWPSMYPELQLPVSYAGILSMIICLGTVVSSLFCSQLTYRWGTGKITAISVGMTAVALLGFSISNTFWLLCLWSIPYGLGAGSVDAALNNYVAIHYSSRHMSWLHCMWGVGASIGPYIIGWLLSGGLHWSVGYRYIGILQIALSVIILFSLPIWKTTSSQDITTSPLALNKLLRIPGAPAVMICFFCYCALEQTAALWSASYLKLYIGFSDEISASLGSLFFIGITAGRAISGFIVNKLNDRQMVRSGLYLIAAGIVILLLPCGYAGAITALLLIGLGCSPIYPCIIHSTPEYFGAEHSQSMIGIQMASAYIGIALMPPLFGFIAQKIHISLLGVFLLILFVTMACSYKILLKKRHIV